MTLHVLADDGLLVVAGDVVPLDAVVVEVVEHGHARLAALPVVGLPGAVATGVGPVVEPGVGVGGGELGLVGGPVKKQHFNISLYDYKMLCVSNFSISLFITD